MTMNRRNDDFAAALLANVKMNDHDRRTAERDLRAAERVVDAVVILVNGSKALARTLRSGFATTAKATPQ